MDIPKTYDPKQAEESHCPRWAREGCFAPEVNSDPAAPPNVTGSLRTGHALQHTIMGVPTRRQRMRGRRTLRRLGTDHAGISTPIMVGRQLKRTARDIASGEMREALGA